MSCSQIPGLGIAVHPSGAKKFFYRRRTAEFDTGRITIGTWLDGRTPDMTIKQAAKACSKLNAEVNSGINPADRRRSKLTAPTMAHLHQRYITDHVMIRNKDVTLRNVKSRWENHISKLRAKPIADVTSDDIAAMFARIAQSHPDAANGVLAQLHKMFELAIDWGYVTANPAHRVKKISRMARQRVLEDHEFPEFMRVVENYPHRDSKDAILLAMYTGQRIGTVLSMRWRDLQLDQQAPMWLIPDSKGGAQRQPLADDAAAILQQRRQIYESYDRSMAKKKMRPSQRARHLAAEERKLPYVFRSRSTEGHLKDISKHWTAICAAAGTDDLHMHDLRRTFVSVAGNNGTDLVVTSRLVGHKNVSTTAKVYTVVQVDPRRQAANRNVAVIKKLASGGGQ